MDMLYETPKNISIYRGINQKREKEMRTDIFNNISAKTWYKKCNQKYETQEITPGTLSVKYNHKIL